MGAGRKIFKSEENNPFLENQINAAARTISLVGKNRTLTLDDVFRKLAEAERETNFVCGFVELYEKNKEYIDLLKEHLVYRGFVVISSDNLVSLTQKGKQRAETPLPHQIEQSL